jgi:two-component system chemotaxis sensor kinase CheA
MFELKQLVQFSHTAENLLDKIRNNQIEITNDIITLFLNIKDHLGDLIDSVIQNDSKELYEDQLVQKTKEFEKQLQEYLDGNISDKIPQEIKQTLDIKQVQETAKENQTKNDSVVSDKKPTIQNSTLKIEAKKIDTLIDLVGEMVITTASVMQHSTRINDKELNESVHQLSRMLEELRETSMKTRMIPIGDTFSRYKRVVRDLSQTLNKDIELILEGNETELDKTVIEKISDPLMHLIRNAIDHGIESQEQREQKGKNKKATIKLKAFYESSSITIVVQDDGKGLDKDTILQSAIEKGVVDKENILDEKQIFDLIMQPGFSTAKELTDISGRGVGMDVVKKNIEELRGTIEISSKKDKGMTVTIRLPLTLAIIDGFMVKISADYYIIPLEMLLECIELTAEYKNFVKDHNFINLRDTVLPILDLKEYFGYEVIDDNIKENIVIVNFGTSKVGLIVDELLGEFQTVMKPMGKVFKNLKGIGGATILGDGKVSPILDIPVLLQYANKTKIKE